MKYLAILLLIIFAPSFLGAFFGTQSKDKRNLKRQKLRKQYIARFKDKTPPQ